MKSNRKVVVTGATGGMGKLEVQRFLANGDTVIATDTKEESLLKLKSEYAVGAKKDGERGVQIEHVAAIFMPLTTVPVIVNGGLDTAKGDAALARGKADLFAFGVPYIANPDLVRRMRTSAP